MHLVYLYINDFRCLKRASFNFDLNYTFEVTDHLVCLKHEREKKMDLESFFTMGERVDDGCVSNISVIVGPNGSGKTTLAFVLQQLSRGVPTVGDCIAIFKNDTNDYSQKEFYFCTSVIKGSEEYVFAPQLLERGEQGPFRAWRKMIYYSPIYTAMHVIMGDNKNVFDVSTTARMRKVTHAEIVKGAGKRGISQCSTYDCRECKEILELLTERKLKDFFKVNPIGVKVFPSRFALAYYQQESRAALVSQDDIVKLIDSPTFDDDSDDRLAIYAYLLDWASTIGSCALSFTLYACDVMRTSFDEKNMDPRRIFYSYAKDLYIFCKSKLVHKVDEDDAVESIKVFLKGELLKYKNRDDWYRGVSFVDLIQCAAGVLDGLRGACLDRVDYKMGALYHEFVIKDMEGKKATDKILEMISCHAASSMSVGYLEFSLNPPLSSGESALLSMYGRILDTLREMRCTQDGVMPVLLFLDEVETALHPSLQCELVSNLIRFFERCTEFVDVQIVFASHSPMLLSDIPKGNVCFLPGREVSMDLVREELDRLPDTFGANIMDLFRLGFFMTNGAVGQFAAKKIKDIIDALESEDTIDDDQIIDLVGDRLVHTYLKGLQREAIFRKSIRPSPNE